MRLPKKTSVVSTPTAGTIYLCSRFDNRSRTSVGYLDSGSSREELGYLGGGPTVVITDLGILRPDPETKELTLVKLHPGTSVEQVREATGWDLRVVDDLGTTDPPTAEELQILRDLRERTEAANKEMQVLDDLHARTKRAREKARKWEV